MGYCLVRTIKSDTLVDVETCGVNSQTLKWVVIDGI
jgi:hypothetical protein